MFTRLISFPSSSSLSFPSLPEGCVMNEMNNVLLFYSIRIGIFTGSKSTYGIFPNWDFPLYATKCNDIYTTKGMNIITLGEGFAPFRLPFMYYTMEMLPFPYYTVEIRLPFPYNAVKLRLASFQRACTLSIQFHYQSFELNYDADVLKWTLLTLSSPVMYKMYYHTISTMALPTIGVVFNLQPTLNQIHLFGPKFSTITFRFLPRVCSLIFKFCHSLFLTRSTSIQVPIVFHPSVYLFHGTKCSFCSFLNKPYLMLFLSFFFTNLAGLGGGYSAATSNSTAKISFWTKWLQRFP